jgi:predicted acyltransferase
MGADEPTPAPRISSLDQFRGYTVLGMFFVNFCGHFQAIPAVFKHHNTYASYADTIMPQFFFAVGFAYRLTFTKRLATGPRGPVYAKALRRNLGLILLGLVVYQLDGAVRSWADLQALGLRGFLASAFQRDPFQTLVHIGVTAIWILPVIAAGPAARIGWAAFSVALHFALSSTFYYEWVMRRPGIDGGPLGFLTWTIPMIVGSLACDAVMRWRAAGAPVERPLPAGRLAAWGLALAALGYAVACMNLLTPPNSTAGGLLGCLVEPPFVPPSRPVNIWTMSQRAGSASYLLFGAGFSLAVYALFLAASDGRGLRLRLLDTLGRNALAGYLIHGVVDEAVRPYAPGDSPLWYALASFALFFAITWLFLRALEKRGIYLRL